MLKLIFFFFQTTSLFEPRTKNTSKFSPCWSFAASTFSQTWNCYLTDMSSTVSSSDIWNLLSLLLWRSKCTIWYGRWRWLTRSKTCRANRAKVMNIKVVTKIPCTYLWQSHLLPTCNKHTWYLLRTIPESCLW